MGIEAEDLEDLCDLLDESLGKDDTDDQLNER